MNASQTTLDDTTAKKLTELGTCQNDVSALSSLHDFAGNVFLKSRNPNLSFSCLEMLEWLAPGCHSIGDLSNLKHKTYHVS